MHAQNLVGFATDIDEYALVAQRIERRFAEPEIPVRFWSGALGVGCWSGLTGWFRKPCASQEARGFKSLSHRQIPVGIWLTGIEWYLSHYLAIVNPQTSFAPFRFNTFAASLSVEPVV